MKSRIALAVGAVLLVAWLAMWHQRIPMTASGNDCGARVYTFGPGMSFDPSEGNQSPEEIEHKSAECRGAAATYWWTGTAFLALGVGVALVGLWLKRAGAESEQA